jgi:hypothetical protein
MREQQEMRRRTARTCPAKLAARWLDESAAALKCEPSQNGGALVSLQLHRNLVSSDATLNFKDFSPLPLWLPSQKGCGGVAKLARTLNRHASGNTDLLQRFAASAPKVVPVC